MSKKIDFYYKTGDVIEDTDTNMSFTIQKFLGKGAFAQCFSAKVDYSKINSSAINHTNKNLKQLENIDRVCLKILNKAKITNDRLREKLSSEICIQKSLNHKNIVKLYHTFSNSVYIILIMEVCDSTLSDLLKQNKKIRESHTKKFVLQLLSAVEYLHSVNVVHRDIKLSNILLSDYSIKLADFGLCALIQKNKRTTVCGTPNYIAPEIITRTAYSFECDIWSTGVLIYTMLIGTPPFQKNTSKDIYISIKKNEWTIPESCLISNEAKDLISKLLVKDPKERLTVPKIFEHPFFTKKDSLINVVLQNIVNNDIVLNERHPKTVTEDTVTFCIYLTKINGLGYRMRSNRHGIYFLNGDSIIRKSGDIYVFITSSVESNKKVLRKEEHRVSGPDTFLEMHRGEIFADYYHKLKYFMEKFGGEKEVQNFPFTFVVRVRRLSGNHTDNSVSTNTSHSGVGYLLGLWNNTLVFSFGSAIITVVESKYVDCIECEYKDVKDLMIKALE